MFTWLKNWVQRLRPLRCLLVLGVLAMILLQPWADPTLSYEGWELVRSTVLPAAMPLVLMLLLLDLLMCLVFQADAEPNRRKELKSISQLYMVLALALIIVWLPVFVSA